MTIYMLTDFHEWMERTSTADLFKSVPGAAGGSFWCLGHQNGKVKGHSEIFGGAKTRAVYPISVCLASQL